MSDSLAFELQEDRSSRNPTDDPPGMWPRSGSWVLRRWLRLGSWWLIFALYFGPCQARAASDSLDSESPPGGLPLAVCAAGKIMMAGGSPREPADAPGSLISGTPTAFKARRRRRDRAR